MESEYVIAIVGCNDAFDSPSWQAVTAALRGGKVVDLRVLCDQCIQTARQEPADAE